ncbi:MAG: hypothetical protein QGI21_05250 [Candidatus Poseidoniaceae archaeon]|nr:hypothetical protein [Candidatus Poseidoniaceae archaeon]
MEKGGFGTSISFDIDDIEAPVRRRARRKSTRRRVRRDTTACPGCGGEISEEEWLDSLVGFVSGAHDFTVGNPVRARIVQTLRNEVSRMNLPSPHDSWELEVVERLMKEIERIVAAELMRSQNYEEVHD